MKRIYSIHHYMWFTALALTLILALCKTTYWYVPIVIYFVVEILGVLVLSIFKGKLKQLPQSAQKAATKVAKR